MFPYHSKQAMLKRPECIGSHLKCGFVCGGRSRLSKQEFKNLRFQFGSSRDWGGRRYAPRAFTEQGVAMLSSVLNNPLAIQVNVQIMRAFVPLRELMLTHRDLSRKLKELEKKYLKHEKQFAVVFQAIQQLLEPNQSPSIKRSRIGFHR